MKHLKKYLGDFKCWQLLDEIAPDTPPSQNFLAQCFSCAAEGSRRVRLLRDMQSHSRQGIFCSWMEFGAMCGICGLHVWRNFESDCI